VSTPEDRITALGHTLPVLGKPLFAYVPFKRVGDVAYISGQVPRHPDGSLTTGLKIFGMVYATPEFGQQPQVIDACSKLLFEVLGENGRHARSAVGMGSLPSNVPVEIEAVIRILD
jgi:enamine deaminase RidA (YjgF/YER057c/UK114 family)